MNTNTCQTFKKQECIIGDTLGTTRVVLWENDVGGLTINKSYKITDVIVCIYKYVSASQKCKLEEIEDIGDVAEMADEDLKAANVVMGCIKAVVYWDDYVCCISYSANFQAERGDKYDIHVLECENCKCKMLRSRCDKSAIAKVIVECTCDAKRLRLTIFDNVLKEIAKNINMCGASISEKLACTPQLQLTIENDIFASARAMP